MPSNRTLRIACAAVAAALAALAYAVQGLVDPRVQALTGILTFLLLIAACSSNLRAVNFRTVVWGIALQLLLAVFILKFEIFGYRPGYAFFSAVAGVAKRFLEFTSAGSTFVFGDLARPEVLGKARAERVRVRLHGAADHHLHHRRSSPSSTTTACCSGLSRSWRAR